MFNITVRYMAELTFAVRTLVVRFFPQRFLYVGMIVPTLFRTCWHVTGFELSNNHARPMSRMPSQHGGLNALVQLYQLAFRQRSKRLWIKDFVAKVRKFIFVVVSAPQALLLSFYNELQSL